jgi:hypothetical protein
VADIIGKAEGLTVVEECLTYETNFDTMLIEKMFQFKLCVVHPVRIPAGEAQVFNLLRPPRACCHIRPERE